MTKANIGNSQVVIKIGQNTVLKAYRGSSVLYNPAPPAPIIVSPLHLANGFLSTLGNDTINDSEFPNAVLANGYLSALYIDDAISISLPDAPSSLSATAGNAQIALAWTAPSSSGDSAIISYTVEYTPSGGSAQTVSTGSTGTSYTLTGLTNGTSYSVRVRAVSASGNGDYSASVTATPYIATVPGAVQIAWAGFGCGNGDFCAFWTAPSSDGGSPITGYRIQATGDISRSIDVIVTSPPRPYYSTGWIIVPCAGNGTLTISAINAIGQGPSETRSGGWSFCD